MQLWQYFAEIGAVIAICFVFMLNGRLSAKNHPLLGFLVSGIGFIGFVLYIALVRRGVL